MTNYATQGVVYPTLDAEVITERQLDLMEQFGFEALKDATGRILFYAREFFTEEAEDSDDDVYTTLQEMLKAGASHGDYISVRLAYTADKPDPDGFGGCVYVITADNVDTFSTHELEHKFLAGNGITAVASTPPITKHGVPDA